MMAIQTSASTKSEAHDRYWKEIETLVVAYAAKNHLGFLTVWGILADKADEGDGKLYDLVLTKHISLYYAVKELGWGKRFLDVARHIFMKSDDDQHVPCY